MVLVPWFGVLMKDPGYRNQNQRVGQKDLKQENQQADNIHDAFYPG